MLCKSFCRASASATEQQDLWNVVGDTAGSMPVCLMKMQSYLIFYPYRIGTISSEN